MCTPPPPQPDHQLSVHNNIVTIHRNCGYSHAALNLCETTSRLRNRVYSSSEKNKITYWNC